MTAIFFDLDGTLTDPRVGIVRSLQYAVNKLGQDCPPEAELTRYIGPPLHQSLPILLGSADAALIDRAVGLYREYFAAQGIFENSLYPAITDVLKALQSRGHALYVVTSKAHLFARQIIEHFGLRDYFQNIHGSELDGTRGDKRELIAHVLEQERIHPGDAMMIGDREHDIKGALANGVRAIGVLWGYGSREELIHAGASGLCEIPADLISNIG